MDKTGENEPARLSVLPDCLRGLQEMFDLGEIGVRVAVVHQRIQVIGGSPDAFLTPFELAKLLFLPEGKSQRLVRMIQPVELHNTRVSLLIIIAELRRIFSLPIPRRHEVIPLIDMFQRFAGLVCAHLKRLSKSLTLPPTISVLPEFFFLVFALLQP